MSLSTSFVFGTRAQRLFMAHFGQVANVSIPSKQGRNALLHIPSARWPGGMHQFLYHSGPTPTNATYFLCKKCRDLKRQNPGNPAVSRITTVAGTIITDPDFPKNAHFCHPTPLAEARADKVVRDMRADIKRNGKRPLQAYHDGVNGIRNKFPRLDHADRGAVEQAVPALHNIARSLQKNRVAG